MRSSASGGRGRRRVSACDLFAVIPRNHLLSVGSRIDVRATAVDDVSDDCGNFFGRLRAREGTGVRPAVFCAQPEVGGNDAGRHERDLDPWVSGVNFLAQVGRQAIEEVLGSTVRRSNRCERYSAQHRRNIDDVSVAARFEVREDGL